MVTGTTLNYFLDNRINRAEILFPGVAASWLQFALLLLSTHLMQLIIKKSLKVFNLKRGMFHSLNVKVIKELSCFQVTFFFLFIRKSSFF